MKININKPCPINWESMSPVEKGRFCNICNKTVHDFTNLAEEDIIKEVKIQPDICGIIKDSHTNNNQQYDFINSLFLKFALGFTITAGGLVTLSAQEKKHDEPKRLGTISVSPKDYNAKPFRLGKIAVVEKKAPLYIVDDIIVDEKHFKNINPDDIEKVNVYTHSQAINLYGELGKNGIIIVTLKKNKK